MLRFTVRDLFWLVLVLLFVWTAVALWVIPAMPLGYAVGVPSLIILATWAFSFSLRRRG